MSFLGRLWEVVAGKVAPDYEPVDLENARTLLRNNPDLAIAVVSVAGSVSPDEVVARELGRMRNESVEGYSIEDPQLLKKIMAMLPDGRTYGVASPLVNEPA